MTTLRRFIILLLCSGTLASFAQDRLSGTFSGLKDRQIRLEGCDGFATYEIARTTASADGSFKLNFNSDDYGIGYLRSDDKQSFIVILAPGEDLMLQGESFGAPEGVAIAAGRQNIQFGQYASEQPRREQALSAWSYLEKIYTLDSLFAVNAEPRQAMDLEKTRIRAEDSLFLAGLDPQSYIYWYLPVRKLVGTVGDIAQYRPEEIPAALAAFRSIDYTDQRLWKSGLLKDVVDGHFWLIENSGRPLDSVSTEMNISIDMMLANLSSDERKFNEINDYLFRLLERRSLFRSSEHLALKILNESGCTLNSDLAKQLESYRAMKKGAIAPDITFDADCLAPGYAPTNIPRKLSDLRSDYTVVVFGASWCPACPAELKQIASLYPKWKAEGVEVLFVSLDTDKQQFNSFVAAFPFISICDYRQWESPAAVAYHIFATPTIFLIDKRREILLRPGFVKQMDAWVNWYLVEGRK